MILPFLFHLIEGVLFIVLVFTGLFLLMKYYLARKNKTAWPVKTAVDEHKIILPLRLQAYERIVLFLERIHPSNLLMRIDPSDLSSVQLQALLVRTIREEFEYNLSQQLYISGRSWELIRNAKEETIAMINQASLRAGQTATSGELIRAILDETVSRGSLAVDLALDEVKKELQKMF